VDLGAGGAGKEGGVKLKVRSCRVVKIPESEFDDSRVTEEWEVLWRGNGFVYIGYRLDFTEMRESNEDQNVD
jgi:hypothetical protein